MFWQDGYQALAALDDDHDGWLRGRELRISDPGEVIPIEQTDIGSIAVRRDGADGISPHERPRGAVERWPHAPDVGLGRHAIVPVAESGNP